MRLPEYYILPKGFNSWLSDMNHGPNGPALDLTPSEISKLKYFITLIYWINFLYSYSSEDRAGWVQLSNNFVGSLIGKNYVSRIQDALDSLGIIDCDHKHQQRRKSFSYRLTDEFASYEAEADSINDHRLLEKIRSKNEGLEEIFEPVYHSIRMNLRRFNFEQGTERKIVRFKGRRRSHRQMVLDLIEGQNSFFSLDAKSGRCFHVLTSCPKALRECLEIDGEPTTEVDIPSAQPLLAATLYNSENSEHLEEKARYLSFVEGDFYTSLNKLARRNLKNRDAMKVACYREIFFNKRLHSTGKLWKALKHEFPILADLIVSKKKESSNAAFATYLQKAEADIVIHTVGKHLNEIKIPFATVHDSIICKKQHARVVKKHLDKALNDTINGKKITA